MKRERKGEKEGVGRESERERKKGRIERIRGSPTSPIDYNST